MRTPEIVKWPTKELRLLLRRLRLRLAGIRVEIDVPKLRIGKDGLGSAPFTICPDTLGAKSVVYSFGIATDVEWDTEMIRRFDVTVHAFDPSPGSVRWVSDAALPDKFVFHPVGIAGHDGRLKLYPPMSTRTVHYSAINRRRSAAEPAGCVDVPVKRLGTILRELGHDHVDLLKLDVDGCEYEVVADLLASGVPVRQIVLEFHHNFPTLHFRDTRRAIRALQRHGYRIFDISHRGREFSLIKTP